MRILHTSDFHGDWKTGGVCRYDDVRDAVSQTVKAAREEKVDLYLMTGDLCDPDDGPRALRAVAMAIEAAMELEGAGIPSWWVPGNHDVFEDGSGESVLSALDALGLQEVRVFPRPEVVGFSARSGGRVRSALILPYPAASHPYDPAAFVKANRSPLTALVATHLQVEGATLGDETTEMARGRDVMFPFEECDPAWLMLSGHYHQGQIFERAGRKLHAVGSLVRLNHGEEKVRPRYLIWDM